MGDEEREEKLFNRHEAEKLLPQLQQLLGGALEKKKDMEKIDQEFAQVQNRILLYGGILPPYGRLAEKKLDRDHLMSGIREVITRIERTGCVVKDLEQGLVDFPTIVDDEQVFLCWKLGEERIGYWHRTDEGFAGRKPLTPSEAPPGSGQKPN